MRRQNTRNCSIRFHEKREKKTGKDKLKEFYEACWDELKTPLMENINLVFYTNTLSVSHRQAVIKLIEKKDLDKRCIKKKWRPVPVKS